jgi:aspartyl protease family protein
MLDRTIKLSAFVFIAFLVIAQAAQTMSTNASKRGAVSTTSVAPTPTPFAQSRGVPVAAAPVSLSGSSLDSYRVAADSNGHFRTEALVNGQPLRVLVDTGATIVSLRNEDAAALGVFLQPADFNIDVDTANGATKMAQVKLREVQLGSILLYDVDALVGAPGVLSANLLGMTFLSRLSRVEIDQGALVLRR